MNHISINTPVKVVNTGDSNVDGLTGRITGASAIGEDYIIYIITLDKPLSIGFGNYEKFNSFRTLDGDWTTITMPDNCLEIIH